MTCRPCCWTAPHHEDCQCWRCISLALADELDAAEYELECIATLPDVKPAKPKPMTPREAPQATIDALMYCFRTRGKTAFNEPANRARLAELSPRQREQLREIVARNKQAVTA